MEATLVAVVIATLVLVGAIWVIREMTAKLETTFPARMILTVIAVVAWMLFLWQYLS